MKKVLSIMLTVAVALSIALLIYPYARAPSNISTGVLHNNKSIVLKTYSGWKGVESLITPLDEYIKFNDGSSVHFSNLLWPYADVQNPFHDILNNGTGVVTVTVLSIDKVYRHNIYVYVVYNARVDKVIVKPQNTIKLPPQTVCVKDPMLCDLAKKQYEAINNLISMIKENNTIKIIVPAFIAKGSANKTNLTVNDVATPFPLLEPGYQYVVFLDPSLDGIHVHYDYVWGPWAYLILNGKVYSLNYVKPPGNVSLDPSKLFKSPYIRWKPYPYEQLRRIAIRKLSVNGEELGDFISRVTKG